MKHKSLKILVSSICLIISALFSTGCFYKTSPPDWEDRAVGDFNVRFYKDYCEIDGTTEEGSSKRFLVIPEYIDGVRVESLGKYNPLIMWGGSHHLMFPQIMSETIEKVYFESALKKKHPYSFSRPLPKLRKVLYPGFEEEGYEFRNGGYNLYFPKRIYENGKLGDGWLSKFPANVSYYYNYEDAKNEGYFWIDDCDYGSKIEFIPKDPVRDGYEFSGWYKEAECVNEWDFDADTLPDEKKELKEDSYGEVEEVTVYQETILYAKWTAKTNSQR